MTDQDDALLQTLRTMAPGRTEIVPPHSRAAARAAFTWRMVDDELARLGYDSTLDTAGVRSGGDDGSRLLTFEAPGVAIDVEVSTPAGGGARRSLLGQATGSVAEVQLQRPDGDDDRTIELDELGAFRADDVEAGVLRLRCLLDENAGGPRVVATEWVAI